MRTYRSNTGPFSEQPFFKDFEVDQLCEDALRDQGFLPSSPEPVRIERFIEKRFMVHPAYEDLPPGVLGYTCFSEKGVASMHIARLLSEEGTRAAERRLNSTLAHEAGHGLMHAHLFAFQETNLQLFGGDPDVSRTQVLCRDGETGSRSRYDGRWWEIQANMAIGALLLPRQLVQTAVRPFMIEKAIVTGLVLDESKRDLAARELADIFDVNPAVSRIRLGKLYPVSGAQLHL